MGKGLFCSTLRVLFEGKNELFKGLDISRTDYDFKSYPVLHINFATLISLTIEEFVTSLENVLLEFCEKENLNIERCHPRELLRQILFKSKNKVAIIIDEFDTPINSNLDNSELLKETINVLKTFYTVIKNHSENVRFLFVTGIAKLSNIGLFSGLNNINDISFDPKYAGICGYTEKEIEYYFKDYIDEYLLKKEREYKTREES